MPRPRRLSCLTVVELVTDYLDAVLTPDVRARLDEHLRSCSDCAEYLRQIRVMVRALGRVAPPAPLDGPARDELFALYRRWIAA